MKLIAEDLFVFSYPFAGNSYLVKDGDGWTIIDTGPAIAGQWILRQIGKHGINRSQIRKILITHAHPDHAGSLPALKDATGAIVHASNAEREILEGRCAIPRVPSRELRGLARLLRPPNTFLPSTSLDKALDDESWIDSPVGGLRVIFTPGHSPGHIVLWQPERKILFAGDLLMNLRRIRPPNVRRIRLPWTFFTVDMAQSVQSLRKISHLEPEVICFGHGPAITHNASSRLHRFINSVLHDPASTDTRPTNLTSE